MDAWLNYGREDAVQDAIFTRWFPVEGRNVHKHYSNLPQTMGRMAFPNLVIHPSSTKVGLWLKYRGRNQSAGHRSSYNNHYCPDCSLSGRTHCPVREYYNPAVLSFGDPSEPGPWFQHYQYIRTFFYAVHNSLGHTGLVVSRLAFGAMAFGTDRGSWSYKYDQEAEMTK